MYIRTHCHAVGKRPLHYNTRKISLYLVCSLLWRSVGDKNTNNNISIEVDGFCSRSRVFWIRSRIFWIRSRIYKNRSPKHMNREVQNIWIEKSKTYESKSKTWNSIVERKCENYNREETEVIAVGKGEAGSKSANFFLRSYMLRSGLIFTSLKYTHAKIIMSKKIKLFWL